MSSVESVVQLVGVRRDYLRADGSVLVEALAGVDLEIPHGQYLAIMGASGSGKSTLLNVLGCLDPPTAGTYMLNGRDVASMDDDTVSSVRGRQVGFIFQSFNLIPELTIVENVEVPLFYQDVDRSSRQAAAIEQLELVGLGDRLDHRPSELSGGQQQRAAVARALVTRPAMLLADEPTGNLDSSTGADLLELLDTLHDEGLTIVVVTHDQNIASRCQRVLHLADGQIDRDEMRNGHG